MSLFESFFYLGLFLPSCLLSPEVGGSSYFFSRHSLPAVFKGIGSAFVSRKVKKEAEEGSGGRERERTDTRSFLFHGQRLSLSDIVEMSLSLPLRTGQTESGSFA